MTIWGPTSRRASTRVAAVGCSEGTEASYGFKCAVLRALICVWPDDGMSGRQGPRRRRARGGKTEPVSPTTPLKHEFVAAELPAAGLQPNERETAIAAEIEHGLGRRHFEWI